jgi:hypothetical protein
MHVGSYVNCPLLLLPDFNKKFSLQQHFIKIVREVPVIRAGGYDEIETRVFGTSVVQKILCTQFGPVSATSICVTFPAFYNFDL